MKSFAEFRGMKLDDHLQLLRANSRDDHRGLMKELNIAVNYQADQVSVHGIELLVFDKKGRYVRRYANTHWNDETVIGDVEKLIRESM
jgi:cytochrome oxidase Cu insertion factor (SCO1/SenC/PrrC family)